MIQRLMIGVLVASVVLLLASANSIRAMYIRPDIETVPVDRLIANLERIVAENPKSSPLRANLARVHAMAFALKMAPNAETQILRGRDAEGAWFGYEHDLVPFQAVASNDPAIVKVAKEHLAKAIELYQQAVELDPTDLTTMLGYGWCLDQSGDRGRAITVYRAVIAGGWATEQKVLEDDENFRNALQAARNNNQPQPMRPPSVFPRPGQRYLTVEASGYLIPLLDREKDRDEIATLQDRLQRFNRLGRSVTPIVIPLRDSTNLTGLIDPSANVRFDADGSGLLRNWTWITPDAGWLVYAPQDSRPVSSALQLFGGVTFWMLWDNGYQALQALDDNGDGVLSGKELEGLAIWRDANSNGKAEAGEVKSLEDWGVVSLSCRHQVHNVSPEYVASSVDGVTFMDGRTRSTYDILLYSKEEALVTH